MQASKIRLLWSKAGEFIGRWIFPLVVMCFLLGDLLACLLGYFEELLLPLLAGAAALFVMAIIWRRFSLLLAAALLLGYFWCGVYMASLDSFGYENGRAVEITGEITEVAATRENYLADISGIGGDEEYAAYIIKGETAEGWRGKVMVGTYGYDLRKGDQVHLVGNVKEKSPLQNWNLDNEAGGRRSEGVAGYIQAIADEVEVIELAEPNPAAALVEKTRNKIYFQIEQLPEKQQQLLKGLAFGDKTQISGRDRSILSQTGVAHVFAVSGLHLGFVIGFVLLALRLVGMAVRLPKALQLAVVMAATLFYAAVCGFTFSVIRAAVMGCGAVAAVIYNENYNSGLALVYAAFVCVLLQPLAFVEVGFILSFLATFALLFTYRIWRGLVKSKAAATVLAAQLMTAPVVAYCFNVLTLSGLLISPLVTFMAGFVVVFGFLGLLFSFIGLSSFFLYIAGFGSEAIFWLCERAAALPASHLAVVKPVVLEVILYYVLLIAAYYFFAHFTAKRRGGKSCGVIAGRRKGAVGLLCLALAFVVLLLPTFIREDDFSVNFIDVGQGDCILVSYDGHYALIDGGGSPYNVTDIGEYVVLPYLRALGIDELDYCINTHPDADHIGGLLAVADQLQVDNLLLHQQYGENDLQARLLALAESRQVQVDFADAGDVFWLGDKVKLTVLSPEAEEDFADGDVNDGSVVTLVSYGDFDVLLTGDLQGDNQQELLACDVDWSEIEVLQIPHHGSRNSYDEEWYGEFAPEAVAISVGKDNSYGHPYQEVVKYWQNRGAQVWRTDIDGSLMITSDGKSGRYRGYAEN